MVHCSNKFFIIIFYFYNSIFTSGIYFMIIVFIIRLLHQLIFSVALLLYISLLLHEPNSLRHYDILSVEDFFVFFIKAPTYISMLWCSIVLESHFLFFVCMCVYFLKKTKLHAYLRVLNKVQLSFTG